MSRNRTWHGKLDGRDVHVPYAFTYANATERQSATGFIGGNVGKLALQEDDNSLWMLIETTPTWVQIGSGSGDLRIGLITANHEETPGYGVRLLFSGGPSFDPWDSDNSDSLWIARYNVASDESELRIQLGDNVDFNGRLVVGVTSCADGLWYPALIVGANGTVIFVRNTEPADSELSNSQFAFWLDDTPGATALKIKAKDSGGTIRTGSINLS